MPSPKASPDTFMPIMGMVANAVGAAIAVGLTALTADP